MTGKNPLDVLNRLVAEGKISQYGICGDPIIWARSCLPLSHGVDILVALPRRDVSDMGRLLALFKDEGYSEFCDDGLKVEGWNIGLISCSSDLTKEALDRAIERDFDDTNAGRHVRGRIVRAEHFAALKLTTNTPGEWNWVIGMVEDEEVDLDALGDVVSRHNLKERWSSIFSK
jgi:uncharacterized membrane protein